MVRQNFTEAGTFCLGVLPLGQGTGGELLWAASKKLEMRLCLVS